jgi:hypothetical protein
MFGEGNRKKGFGDMPTRSGDETEEKFKGRR